MARTERIGAQRLRHVAVAPVTPLAPGDRVQTTWRGSLFIGLVGVVVELRGARVLVDYGEHGEVLMFASELARVGGAE